jgi:predicted transcriptional regulator
MGEFLHKKIRDKRTSLKASVALLSKVLQIPADNIYKWEKGTNPSDFEQRKKIESFLNGNFDSLIVKQKAFNSTPKSDKIESPYDKFSEQIEVVQLKEELIKSQQITIDAQKKIIENLEAQIRAMSSEGKAGARRHSA